MIKRWRLAGLLGLGLAGVTGVLAPTREASACGGFFCSASQPVNQAAERIVFANNGDGTVTAVIQIRYQGAASKFSWLLPISTIPTGDSLGVASNVSFQRLQSATNPQYTLTQRVEGSCKSPPPSAGGGGASATGGASSIGPGSGPVGVVVEASGTVGAFDWTVISVDPALSDATGAAVNWLQDNGYTVGEGAPGLLRPYLASGLYLLALKLSKGADVGAIRPLMLSYEATRPMIPIKLTAVAANDDMGVMAWLLDSARGVPQNYLSLELNEARINWFNPSANYDAVVTAAADEAGGQGFVTEFAGANPLTNRLWSTNDEEQWQAYQAADFANFPNWFDRAYAVWGQWDGFWEVMRQIATLPAPQTFEDLRACPGCFTNRAQFASGTDSQRLLDGLRSQVIEPVMNFQKLFDAHPYLTRLYTTMSAQEMTVDPLFTFNASLPDVSNLHQAERVIECRPDLFQSEAPWRVQLAAGLVRGTGRDAAARSWPAFTTQPSNSRIVRVGATGPGVVLEDNSTVISEQLDAYNQSLPTGGSPAGGGGSGGQGTSGGNPGAGGGNPGTGGGNPGTSGGNPGTSGGNPGTSGGNPGTSGGNPGTSGGNPGTSGGNIGEMGGDRSSGGSAEVVRPGGGCAVAFGAQGSQWTVPLFALGVAGLLRRRRR